MFLLKQYTQKLCGSPMAFLGFCSIRQKLHLQIFLKKHDSTSGFSWYQWLRGNTLTFPRGSVVGLRSVRHTPNIWKRSLFGQIPWHFDLSEILVKDHRVTPSTFSLAGTFLRELGSCLSILTFINMFYQLERLRIFKIIKSWFLLVQQFFPQFLSLHTLSSK